MIYLPLAHEIAMERSEEARRRALAAGRSMASGGANEPRRPNRARTLLARPVRALSDASHAVSEAACSAATRIEGVAR